MFSEFTVYAVIISMVVLYCLAKLSQLLAIFYCKGQDDKNRCLQLPPGPFRIPIFGYMPFMAFNPQKALAKLVTKYGNVFTIYLGNYRVVVLNDYRMIKEAFKEDNFSGRPDLKMLEVRNQGVRRGLVCSDGKEWAEQRKFTIRQLKDLGLGKHSIRFEHLVHEEIDELITGLQKDEGNSVNLQHRLTTAVLNVIWRITCGERYKHDDHRLQTILEKTGADLAETQYTGPLLFLPWLIKFAPGLTRWSEFVTSVEGVHSFLANIINEHKVSYNPDERRDFIDSYLAEIQRTSDPTSSFYKQTGEHSLLVVLLDLFMAGSDTTSATLYWAFLYMILNQEVQIKVQQEIDEIIGSGTPRLEHRKKMIYTEATMMEILRKSSLVPLGLFHNCMSDTNFSGYHIPKDTVLAANLYYVNNSEQIYGDPANFRPERWIDDNNQIKKCDAFMPFSTGKRICIGENISKDQLFLFFVSLLNAFTFIVDNERPKPTDSPNIGVILSPKPYFIKAIPRTKRR